MEEQKAQFDLQYALGATLHRAHSAHYDHAKTQKSPFFSSEVRTHRERAAGLRFHFVQRQKLSLNTFCVRRAP